VETRTDFWRGGALDRPDSIACIAQTHVFRTTYSWCGRYIQPEFHFLGVDHAVNNMQGGGRSLPCRECVRVLVALLDQPELYDEEHCDDNGL
jgi:hypothetical protein